MIQYLPMFVKGVYKNRFKITKQLQKRKKQCKIINEKKTVIYDGKTINLFGDFQQDKSTP